MATLECDTIKSEMASDEVTLDRLRARREIQLWTVALEDEAGRQPQYWQTLSADERARAERFHFARDRDAYIRARGTSRRLLSEYLSLSPSAIVFTYGAQGKPAVAGQQDLQFNLAHSGDYALYAFCAGAQVGVDIERMRKMDDQESLARRFFCAEEYAELMTLSGEARARAFFAGWTRKEAFLKALGVGLTKALHSFRVSLLPDAPARLLSGASDEWTLFDFPQVDGYGAAVAIEGTGYFIRTMSLAASRGKFFSEGSVSPEMVFHNHSVRLGT
jgi:4'-phosphopantetheinyl transferase